jgi:hypothetical protein
VQGAIDGLAAAQVQEIRRNDHGAAPAAMNGRKSPRINAFRRYCLAFHVSNTSHFFLQVKGYPSALPSNREASPFHVIEWADSPGDAWSHAYRRRGIVAIQRPFNWAEELGYIPASPIKKISKP